MDKTHPTEPEGEAVDLTKDLLGTPSAVELLGTLAAASLLKYGEAHFSMRPDGGVTYIEPWKVAMEEEAVEEVFHKKFRYVRPILGDGQPQVTVWRNGMLWEIEFVDEKDPSEDTGS